MYFYAISFSSLFLIALTLLCNFTVAQNDDHKRISLPRRPIGKAAKTTTTTTPAPPPLAEGEEGDYPEEGQDQYGDEVEEPASSSTTTTTTEAPKKIGPVIRPFRSNDDLLNSLKRRQMNAKKNKIEKPTPKSRPAPVEDEYDSEEQEEAAPPTPAKTFKANSALSRRKISKPSRSEPADDVAAAESEHPREETRKRPQSFSPLKRRN